VDLWAPDDVEPTANSFVTVARAVLEAGGPISMMDRIERVASASGTGEISE
jgi:hypothetical protein